MMNETIGWAIGNMNEIISWVIGNLAMALILFFTAASFIVMVYNVWGSKPRVMIYFPDKSTNIKFHANEEATINLHIENKGDLFRIKKPMIHGLNFSVYFPLNFEIYRIKFQKYETDLVKKSPAEGILKHMQYLSFPTDNMLLFYKEIEVCSINIKTPSDTGMYDIFIPTFCVDEGDLGIKKLKIIVV